MVKSLPMDCGQENNEDGQDESASFEKDEKILGKEHR